VRYANRQLLICIMMTIAMRFAQGQGEMTMRALLIIAVVCFSASALAQTEAPKTGKSPRQVKPQVPMGCKLVGTVRGTKLWAGECAPAAELRGATPAEEPEANPPAAAKQ
jgi:hypothetical protein